jgi:hypothetical protein
MNIAEWEQDSDTNSVHMKLYTFLQDWAVNWIWLLLFKQNKSGNNLAP